MTPAQIEKELYSLKRKIKCIQCNPSGETPDLTELIQRVDDLEAEMLTKQDELGFTPENIANKGINNGYTELDSGGKVPLNRLPSTLLVYKGVWNATTNTPTLANNDISKAGFVYNVGTAGNQFSITWSLGDWLIYNDSGVIEKSDNSDDVVSVNGQQGVVVLTKSNISLGNVDNTSDVNKPVSTAQQTALDLKRGYARTTNGDSNYIIPSTTRVAATSATLSAPRVWTLPAASSVPAGEIIEISDGFGGISSTNTLTIQRAGADTINGATSLVIAAAYGARRIISNGSNSWAFDAGVLRASNNLSDIASASISRTNLGAQATITTSTNILAADVPITNNTSYFTGASLSLAAGTYIISGNITATRVASSVSSILVRLFNSTDATVLTGGYSRFAGTTTMGMTYSISGWILTIAGTKTITLDVKNLAITSGDIINSSIDSGATTGVTYLTAIKIA